MAARDSSPTTLPNPTSLIGGLAALLLAATACGGSGTSGTGGSGGQAAGETLAQVRRPA